jgi:SAM-dependent methyltransferase
MTKPDSIKRNVSRHYAGLALNAQRTLDADGIAMISMANEAACCDDSCCVPQGLSEEGRTLVKGLYAENEVAGLPSGVLEAVAGCGNPTAIAEIRPGETVLDLGSGGGIDCFLAAKQVGPSGKVIGVDMTVEMVELARRNAFDLGVENVVFKLGEIEDLPVADASVDVVISNCVVNLSPNKSAVFSEVARVLKPGGRFRVSDIVWTGERPGDAATFESWAGCIAGALEVGEFLSALERSGLMRARTDSVRFLDQERGLASALISADKPIV